MSAPHQQQQNGGSGGPQKRRPHPHNRQRKPKGPAHPNGAGGAASTAPPAFHAPGAIGTPLSNASTVTTPSATPRAPTPVNGAATGSSTFSQIKFSDFLQQGLISPQTAAGIASGGYVNCTEVQAQTLPTCLTGEDVCASFILRPSVPSRH